MTRNHRVPNPAFSGSCLIPSRRKSGPGASSHYRHGAPANCPFELSRADLRLGARADLRLGAAAGNGLGGV